MRVALVLVVALVGCNKGGGEDTQEPAVTYWKDMVPFMQRTCQRCHNGTGVGPHDFTTYEDSAAYAVDMLQRVDANEMPPPTSDPACRDYHGSEYYHLSDEEISLLEQWVELGAPEGNKADAPDPVDLETHLTDANLTLTLPEQHSVDTSGDNNEYYCYVVPHGQSQAFAITAFDTDVANDKVVHHMLLFKDPNGDAGSGFGGADAAGGFACDKPIMENDWQFLHAWAPGMPPTEFAAGQGMTIEPSDQLVLQMHYYSPDSGSPVDQSSYKLRTVPATQVDTEVRMFPIGPTGFTVPAGNANYAETFTYTNGFGFGANVLGVFPHMHMLGTDYEARIVHANGDETCLAQGPYQFHFQATYMYEEPAYFGPGDTVHMTCHWDNTATNPNQYNDPPQDVTFGEGTDQEMCFFLTYLTL